MYGRDHLEQSPSTIRAKLALSYPALFHGPKERPFQEATVLRSNGRNLAVSKSNPLSCASRRPGLCRPSTDNLP